MHVAALAIAVSFDGAVASDSWIRRKMYSLSIEEGAAPLGNDVGLASTDNFAQANSLRFERLLTGNSAFVQPSTNFGSALGQRKRLPPAACPPSTDCSVRSHCSDNALTEFRGTNAPACLRIRNR
jgi:hypothetical protein